MAENQRKEFDPKATAEAWNRTGSMQTAIP